MNNPGKLENRYFIALRWLARILGSLTALLVTVFGIAYAIGGELSFSEKSELLTSISVVSVFTVWVAGMVISWKWEDIGGGMLVLNSIIFYIFVPNAMDWPPNPLIVFPIAGILFLICWWKSRAIAP